MRMGRATSAWAAVGLLGLAACGSAPSAGGASRPAPSAAATLSPPALSTPASAAAPEVPDFGVVAYQGDQVFGGHDGHFSAVFAAGRPVVLLYFAGLWTVCRAEMPGFARVAGEYEGRVTFVAVDIGPFVGLGNHDDGVRLLQMTGTTYPAAYAVDRSALARYGVLDTPTTIQFDRTGRVVRKVPSALGESALRQQVAALAST